jgi:hypothetical protein
LEGDLNWDQGFFSECKSRYEFMYVQTSDLAASSYVADQSALRGNMRFANRYLAMTQVVNAK